MHAHILPHPATFALAAALIAGGAPLFSSGLRALRLRRELGRARAATDPAQPGYVALSGRVALESPLFSPLSARPCAGFRLEVRGLGAEVANEIVVARGFSIAHAGGVVHVVGHAATVRVLHETETTALATGTDDVAETVTTEFETEETVIGPSSLDYLSISDAAPVLPVSDVAWYRTLGLAAGPLLALAGLWLLMHAADQLTRFGSAG